MAQYVHKDDEVQLTAIFMKSLQDIDSEAYRAVDQYNLLIGKVVDVADDKISIVFGDFGRLSISADNETLPYLLQILRTGDGRDVPSQSIDADDKRLLELSFSVEIIITKGTIDDDLTLEDLDDRGDDMRDADFLAGISSLGELLGVSPGRSGLSSPKAVRAMNSRDIFSPSSKPSQQPVRSKVSTAKWFIEHVANVQRFIFMQDLARRSDSHAPHPMFIDHPLQSQDKDFRALRYELSAAEEQTYNTALNVLRNYMLGQALDSHAGLQRPTHPEVTDNDEDSQ